MSYRLSRTKHDFLGVMLIVGSIAIPTACSQGHVAPDPPAPEAAPPPVAQVVSTVERSAPEPTAAPAVRKDLSPHWLDKFLSARKRMHDEVYKKTEARYALARWIVDGESVDPRAAGDARLQSVLHDLNRERYLGMAEAGMHESNYRNVEEIVYDQWWKATAAGRDVDKLLAFQEELRGLIEDELRKPDIDDARRRDFETRLLISRHWTAHLEWTRTADAVRTLDALPPETLRLCEDRAEEIDRYAMLSLQPYTELFSVTGVRPWSALER